MRNWKWSAVEVAKSQQHNIGFSWMFLLFEAKTFPENKIVSNLSSVISSLTKLDTF